MENIFDRLQFVRHEEIFATREEAYNYVINHQIRGDYPTITDPHNNMPALLGEPMILLYDNSDESKGPNVILAIGSVGDGKTASNSNRTFFIDTQKTEEEIVELNIRIDDLEKLIGIIPVDSDTIDMSAEKTENGTIISGDVKIADYEIIDNFVNNNIIKTIGDKGIYAFVDMDYDPETFVITFNVNGVTKEFQLPHDQHVVKGWYDTSKESIVLKLADNSKVEIDVVKLIDEWTVLPDSTTPVMLTKEHVHTEPIEGVYEWQDVLKADIRVADHISDNIIHKDRTGRYLYVKGTADNIKYKEGVTVKDALDNIDCKVSTSTGNLIYKRPDGIFAYAMLDYNTAENKLKYTYSDGNAGESKTVEFKLNSVKLLEDITYDPVNEMIVIRYIDAQGEYQRVEIPVKDIIEEWDVNNEAHNVNLVKYRSQGQGKDILSADAKIYDGDNNILEDKNHQLYVNGIASNIKYNVTGETNVKNVLDNLSASTNALDEKIDQEIADRTADVERIDNTIGTGFTSDPHENVTYKFEELTNNLNSEVERATSAETALDEKIEAEIERATNAEEEIKHALSAETTARISADTALQTAIENEIARATSAETTLTHLIEDEASNRESADAQLNTKIEIETARAREAETRIETNLNNEISRAQTKEGELNVAITNETLRAQEADNELYQKIADETADRASKDAELESLINQEASRAQVAENSISERLTSEITRSTNEDHVLRDLLTAETAARQEGDTELENAIREATLTFDDTTSIDFTKTSENVVSAEVKLQGGDNIIKLGQGLYATATLEYEPTGNKLRLVTSNGAQEYIQLVGATLLDSIEYDPINKLLIIKYTDGTGSHRETTVGVTDLWNEWVVQNPSEKSAVELTKVIGDPGNPDTISGKVLITDDRDGDGKPDEGSVNLIEIRNNGLFVDGSALSGASGTAECVKNELKAVEKAVIGHIVGEECGEGYTYEPNNMAQYINTAISFYNADYILDQAIKNVDTKVDEVSAKTDCVDDKADKIYGLLNGAGSTIPECGEGLIYHPYTGACIISAATSFYEADLLLNDQVCRIFSMWTSGKTCSTESEWVENGANRKMEVNVRLSRGRLAEMTDDDVYIKDFDGDYVDPTTREFSNTNVLRIVCLEEAPSGTTPSIDSLQNGVYLSNAWDCGLYYGTTEADQEAKAAAEAAGYITNYSTDEDSSASNYNYMNNVRQHDIPST